MDQLHAVSKKLIFNVQDFGWLKLKGYNIYMSGKIFRKHKITVLISEKYYRVKKNTGNRKGTLFNDRGALVPRRIAILDVYVLNNTATKYVYQKIKQKHWGASQASSAHAQEAWGLELSPLCATTVIVDQGRFLQSQHRGHREIQRASQPYQPVSGLCKGPWLSKRCLGL